MSVPGRRCANGPTVAPAPMTRLGGDAVGADEDARADLGVGEDDAVADARAVSDLGAPAQRHAAAELDVDPDLDAGLHVGGRPDHGR